MIRFRATIKWVAPVAGQCPAGWRYVVVDLTRLPSQQVILTGSRDTQPQALAAACAQIQHLAGGGQ